LTTAKIIPKATDPTKRRTIINIQQNNQPQQNRKSARVEVPTTSPGHTDSTLTQSHLANSTLDPPQGKIHKIPKLLKPPRHSQRSSGSLRQHRLEQTSSIPQRFLATKTLINKTNEQGVSLRLGTKSRVGSIVDYNGE